jgi:hypothetical protein
MLRRIGRPSPATLLAFIALLVALGGTAWAAVTSVNIADPLVPSNVARVDGNGQLKTSGYVGQAAPKNPWFGKIFMSTGVTNPVITANGATIALTRIVVDNYYGQTNGATVQVSLIQNGGNASTCDGSSGSRTIGIYDVRAGSAFADAMESPIVLKPLVSNTVWCLNAFASVQGSPGSYFLPALSTSGYVALGSFPDNAVIKNSSEGGSPAQSSARRRVAP